MHAAARVGDPFGHAGSMDSFWRARDSLVFGLFVSRGSDTATDAATLGRIVARGITGGRFAASDGQLTIGSPNVSVNGRPATMTVLAAGLCRQHAGLQSVATGSFGVSINGRQAARVADLMYCQAPILEGSPDVFIGTGTPPTVCDTLRADTIRLAQLQREALVAQAAYDAPEDRVAPPGYRNATDEELARLKLDRSMLEHPINPQTGQQTEFRAAVFIEEATGAPLVAFKGTTMDSWEDWKENFTQGLGNDSFYYTHAQNVGRAVTTAPNGAGANARFTGHSLGGGMASAAARATGRPATTFNAAGLHPETVPHQLPSPIDGVYVEGEPLRASQSIPRTPATAETRTWALPPDEPSLAGGMRQAYERDGIVAAAKYGAMRSFNFHKMEEVIQALALKQRALVQAMEANGCG